MDQEKWVESIIKEVMIRLLEMHSINDLENAIRQQKILAIAMSDHQILSEIRHRYRIDFYEDYNEHEDHIDINVYDAILLGSISHQELVHISMGLANNPVSSLVIEAILAGKKIFILKEGVTYQRYEHTSNTNFYNMLKGYEEQLKTFGIKWIYANEIVEKIENPEALREAFIEEKKIEEYVVEVKIITESIAKQYHKNGCQRLMIKKHTIVTPLARDYLRDKRIIMITT
jgi:ethanolamine utilization protein